MPLRVRRWQCIFWSNATFVSFRSSKKKKLTGVKLLCKLLINMLLEMFKTIIDHKKQEHEGL